MGSRRGVGAWRAMQTCCATQSTCHPDADEPELGLGHSFGDPGGAGYR